MTATAYLPKLGSDLVAALARLDMNDLSHGLKEQPQGK
jgi:hypothetical protein